jgi:hypothetical protein
MSTVIEQIEVNPVEIPNPEPDLIDRIAQALPKEFRAAYYRELHHCRYLPESDEMLRLLRAMQFLVLLIEQAPARVTEERELLDKLLTRASENFRRMSAASEAWHAELEQRLRDLPAQVAWGINPRAVAAEINKNLQQEFVRSTIPQTADALRKIAGEMKAVSSDFWSASRHISESYKGSAEEARAAVAAMRAEISEAGIAAARFRSEVIDKHKWGWRWTMAMLAGGSMVLGLAAGMMLERFLFPG